MHGEEKETDAEKENKDSPGVREETIGKQHL